MVDKQIRVADQVRISLPASVSRWCGTDIHITNSAGHPPSVRAKSVRKFNIPRRSSESSWRRTRYSEVPSARARSR